MAQRAAPFELPGSGAWHGAARARLARLVAAWLAAEHRRFVLWLPVALGGGVLAYFDLNQEPPWWLGPAIAGAGFAVAFLLRRRPLASAPALLAACFGLGIAAATLATAGAPPLAVLPRHATIVTGRITLVEPLPNGSRITIARPSLNGAPPIARRLRIRLHRGDPIRLAAGEKVKVRALLEPPFPPSYPGAWDVQRSSFFSGFGGYGFALNPAILLAPAAGGPARRLEALREGIERRIRRALPGPEGAIGATLMTGISTAIPEADRAAFRDSGLAHLLAVAGLHIGIVMGFVFMLSRALLALSERATLYWPTKKIAALAALGAGGLYMLLTGMHVPIMRSFAMAVLAVAGLIAGRRVLSLRGLALAATLLLLLQPAEVVGVSFQMSFAAVLVLISGYEALRPWLSRLHGAGTWGRLGLHVLALALTSLFAGTAALPFGAYHFGHIQIYYVLANLIAVPITAVLVMPAGLVSLALMPVHLERLALVPMGWGIRLLLGIARTVSALPAARIAVPHMPSWGLGLVGFGLAWLCLWRSRLRLGGIPLILAGFATAFLVRPPDILVSRTAGLVGLDTAQGVFVQKTGRGASRFTHDAWRELWPGRAFRPLPANGVLAGGALRCTPDYCLFRPHAGGAAALLLRSHATPQPCPPAAVVVSPHPDRRRCTEGGLPLIDRFSVWRNGPYALWLGRRGVRIVSDRSLRGDRPWVPPLPQPRGAAARSSGASARGANHHAARGSALPMAPTIRLPPQ
ncbi:MAG: ComEC/Rec2 family competence protein [Rhodospirillales bacterium]|nr:ComEC/Rec2 family competence protein [Rhodospirillales bacterium]